MSTKSEPANNKTQIKTVKTTVNTVDDDDEFHDATDVQQQLPNEHAVNDDDGSEEEEEVQAAEPQIVAAENMEVSDNSAVGKIRAIFGMLTKFIGVKDIINLRVSLPASLLDPVSNLEFWSYMERPDVFLEIPDPECPVDRMLKVTKYWMAKDAKFTSGKLAKPYNSILGEQFLCHFDVPSSTLGGGSALKDSSKNVAVQTIVGDGVLQVHCLTEQISHHPPISAYYYYNDDKGILARGVDHVCAKFTGTSMKVFSGSHNRGIYVGLKKRDNEEYLCTHPTAYINGWLKGSLYLTIGEHTVISCPRTRLRTIVEYKDESYFTSAKYLVQGKVFRYDPDAPFDEKKISLTKIPESDVVCNISGCWRGVISVQKTVNYAKFYPDTASTSVYPYSASKMEPLMDMMNLPALPKIVAPLEEQKPQESRKIWHDVTLAIQEGRFDAATKAKRALEDAQRSKTAERKSSLELHHSYWFGFSKGNDKVLRESCVKNPELYEESVGIDPMSAGVMGKPFLRADRSAEFPWLMKKK